MGYKTQYRLLVLTVWKDIIASPDGFGSKIRALLWR
jgi:hypothetical protein